MKPKQTGIVSLCFLPRLFILLLGGLTLTGCCSFNRQGKAAAPMAASSQDITGRWEGSWRSDVNGHEGRLRCLITKISDHEYRAYYHAKYRKILSFSYAVPLQVEATNGAFQFKGQADLGWYAGGVYRYEGNASGTNFFSTYHSKYDHGQFHMSPYEQPSP